MKEREENRIPQDKDPHLDIPAESERDKHINFLDIEDPIDENSHKKDDVLKERQKEWKEGLEEGRKEREGRE